MQRDGSLIVIFEYKCRRCPAIFGDPGLPQMEVASPYEAETILSDSLYRNPVVKKRAKLHDTHKCEENVVGIGDLVGYRISENGPAQTQGVTRLRAV